MHYYVVVLCPHKVHTDLAAYMRSRALQKAAPALSAYDGVTKMKKDAE